MWPPRVFSRPGQYNCLRNAVFVFCFVCFLLYFIVWVFFVVLFCFRERDRELETSMREKHRSAASCTPPTGDVPATKGHAPDRHQTRTLKSAADALSTEPHQSGKVRNVLIEILNLMLTISCYA
uniref:Uncharacterized protein n=1 Tax=Pipistrellus kuhlii TaxID=59472 RepID=A0A7J7R8F4_PIPKU|nr:hypothetical protein mPipKuh1_010836 [Pipistrellus kuhlii]